MPTATCPHLWPTTMPREGSHISAHTERCWDLCRGKTTLLKCLAAAIPSRERVVTAAEVFQPKIPLPDVVSMQCRQESLEGTGEIKLRRLAKEALRMRPSRSIVG